MSQLSNNLTTLYLARHGETQWNKVKRFQGQLDSELTTLGKQQSYQLAINVKHNPLDLIVSSSLNRAIATADICQQQLPIPHQVNNKLNERNLGRWQGQYIRDLTSQAIYHEVLHELTNVAPEGGESAIICGQRIYKAIEEIALECPNKHILIICHGEALRCFLSYLGQTLTGNAYDLFNNGSVCQLTYQSENGFSHLEQLPNG